MCCLRLQPVLPNVLRLRFRHSLTCSGRRTQEPVANQSIVREGRGIIPIPAEPVSTEVPGPGGTALPGKSDGRKDIDYWKIRARYEGDAVVFSNLSRSFRLAGALDEEIEYWVRRVENAQGPQNLCVQKVAEAFLEKNNLNGLVRFWNKLDNRLSEDSQIILWTTLTPTLKKLSPSYAAALDICKKRLRNVKSDPEPIYILAEHASSFKPDSIALWKNIVKLTDGINRAAVFELEEAAKRKNDILYSISMWKSMVRNYPTSWNVAKAMKNAFESGYDEPEAKEFWEEMMITFPDVSHFAEFLAEFCIDSGDFKRAVEIWKMWLERFLTKKARARCGPDEDEFSIARVCCSLENILSYGGYPNPLQFWDQSLRDYPPISVNDIRRYCFARASLAHRNHSGTNETLEILKKSATICPFDDDVSGALSEMFVAIGDCKGLIAFWDSVAKSFPEPWPSWAHLRLAQHYSSRREYAELLDVVKGITPGQDLRVDEACAQLAPGDHGKEFWDALVRSAKAPPQAWIDKLKQSWEKLGGGDIEMWKDLLKNNPHNHYLWETLSDIFKACGKQVEEKAFCIKMMKFYDESPIFFLRLHYVFEDERALCKTVAFRDAVFDAEITVWKQLVEEFVRSDKDCYFVCDSLHEAVEERVEEYTDMGSQPTKEVWEDVRIFWERMIALTTAGQFEAPCWILQTFLDKARSNEVNVRRRPTTGERITRV